jgi:hypothetical protein
MRGWMEGTCALRESDACLGLFAFACYAERRRRLCSGCERPRGRSLAEDQRLRQDDRRDDDTEASAHGVTSSSDEDGIVAREPRPYSVGGRGHAANLLKGGRGKTPGRLQGKVRAESGRARRFVASKRP